MLIFHQILSIVNLNDFCINGIINQLSIEKINM